MLADRKIRLPGGTDGRTTVSGFSSLLDNRANKLVR